MNQETVLVILPLPPSCLSPNCPPGSFGGRMRRAVASKQYRKKAYDVVSAMNIESGPWDKATVSAIFYHKQKRRRDDVNHMAMLKSAYDGVVDAGLLADDSSSHLKTLGAEFKIANDSRVELLFTRI